MKMMKKEWKKNVYTKFHTSFRTQHFNLADHYPAGICIDAMHRDYTQSLSKIFIALCYYYDVDNVITMTLPMLLL
jgi:hypothetical protein